MPIIRFKKSLPVAASFLFMPTLASAHTGFSEASGLLHGMIHPISGMDHLLAMIMVGVLAQQLGRRAIWLVPITFLSLMTIGGALGIFGFNISLIETGIAASVIMLGAMVAIDAKIPISVAMGVVGFFALFHGYAHGAEMPENIGGFTYAVGFLMATGTLHAVGIGLGLIISDVSARHGSAIVRATGALASFAGIGLLLNVVAN